MVRTERGGDDLGFVPALEVFLGQYQSRSGIAVELEREIGAAVRLGLENERLQAESLSRLEELRASRARIVA